MATELTFTATAALRLTTDPQTVIKSVVRGWDFTSSGTPLLFMDSVPSSVVAQHMTATLVRVGQPHPAGMTSAGVRQGRDGNWYELFVQDVV